MRIPHSRAYLNDCYLKEVVVTLGGFNFKVPLRLYAIVRSSSRDLRYGGATPRDFKILRPYYSK